MGIKTVFTCDACDFETEKRSAGFPASWAEISIHAEKFANWPSGGGKEFDQAMLLCPGCQVELTAVLLALPRSLVFRKAAP